MHNLLPFEEKKKIRTAYRFRLGVVAISAIVLIMGINLVLLIPSYMLALSKHDLVAKEVADLETQQSSLKEAKEFDVQIKLVNKKIDNFLESGEKVSRLVPSEVLTKIMGVKGAMIKIQNITYDSSGKQERLVLSGKANNRDGLASFVEDLKKTQIFTSVELPISSYVKSVDIDFSVVLDRKLKLK